MSNPNHSTSCLSKCFKTKCPDCGEEVFFYMCSCGSKVFFESLGAPWKQHQCWDTEILKIVDELTDEKDYSFQDIYDLINNHIMKTGQKIPLNIEDLLNRLIGKRKVKTTKMIPNFNPELKLIVGYIRNLDRNVNVYKLCKLNEKDPFSEMVLGKLGKKKYHKIELLTLPNEYHRQFSYSILISSVLLIDKIVFNTKVYAVSLLVPNSHFEIWEADTIIETTLR